MTAQSLYERAGGEPKVRAIIEDFVGRMVNDMMIGFFFTGVDRARLVEHEFGFTAAFLGATDIPYEGRSMRNAHAAHRIFGGQFARRRQILIEVLKAHDVPQDIATGWVGHVDSLRDQVTSDATDSCD